MNPKPCKGAFTCPWCDTIPTIEPWHGGGKMKRMIACDNEDCEVRPQVTGPTPSAALHNWNTRKGNRP